MAIRRRGGRVRSWEIRWAPAAALLLAAAAGCARRPTGAIEQPVPARCGVVPPSRGELDARLGAAIARSERRRVEYRDGLGEGPGAWHDAPRQSDTTTNCLNWLLEVVSEAYGGTGADALPVLDRLRYFGGHVGFGLRKHYVDQWMQVDPGPFEQVDPTVCGPVRRRDVRLEPETFLRTVGYPCPLYGMDRRDYPVTYTGAADFVACARRFAPGYYVLNAVATDRYLRRFGRTSGPMGLVHAFFLQVKPATPKAGGESDLVVHHASVVLHRVVHEPLTALVRRSLDGYDGYVAYRLNPDWDWRRSVPLTAEMAAVQRCERELTRKGGHRDPGADFRLGR